MLYTSSKSESSAAVSMRAYNGMTSSSQAITATARNSRPLAGCMLLIETWSWLVSMPSSKTLNGNPARVSDN